MGSPSQLCERSRAWSSLRADGELSELESALLDAHLARCEACRSFARGTATVAATLRHARLEPAPPVAGLPVVIGRRRSSRRAVQAAAAVLVVVSAGLGAALAGSPGGKPAAAKPVAMVAGTDSPDRLRELRRPGLVEKGRSAAARHRQELGSI